MTNTYKHAKTELDILSKSSTDPNNRPLIEPFMEEILALCEKFGQSGQSGGSAPFTATALANSIKKLCLQEPISEITGIEEEWVNISEWSGGKEMYQNKRCSALFKEGKNGKPYYIDAIIKKTQNGTTWNGPFWMSKEDYLSGDKNKRLSSVAYVKSFPFTPKTFYIDVIEEEVKPDDWEMYVKDPIQLDRVWKYYDKK